MTGATNKDLLLRVGFDIDRFQSELNKTSGKLNQWSNNIMGSLKGLAAGFGAIELGKFALDVARIAGEAEGVRAAFEKLPNSTQLMLDLKQATAGTVSELDLMKRSVQAANFGISMQALPKLLEFAAVRAQQTGQSVDYLVDSIVTGIGRKSLLILDNLGLSSVRINEELKKTPDYARAIGNIASQELEKMGSMSDNTATKLQQLNASFVNLKVALGDAANGTGVLGRGIAALTAGIDVAASSHATFWEKLIAFANGPGAQASLAMKIYSENVQKAADAQKLHELVVREADRALATFGDNMEALKKAYQQNINYTAIIEEITRRQVEADKLKISAIENIANLTARQNELQELQKVQTGQQLAQTNIELKQLDEKIKKLKELGTVTEQFSKALTFQGEAGGFVIDGQMGERKLKARQDPSKFNALGLSGIDLSQFNEETEKLAAHMEQVNLQVFALAEGFGEAIGGAKDFGDAMGRMAKSVINQLLNIAQGWVIANHAKLGPAGLAMVGVSLGLVRGLFSKIGSGGGGGVGSEGSRYSRVDTLGNRVEVVGAVSVSGTQMNILLSNQARVDNRTKARG